MHFITIYLGVSLLIHASLSHNHDTPCECDPACPHVGLGECTGRLVPRGDCPCCEVCSGQKGDTCSQNTPCDVELGLTCSKGICTALSHCTSDAQCADDLFCIKESCTDPCHLLQPCLGKLKGGTCVTKNHQPSCICPSNHFLDEGLKTCVPTKGCFVDGKNMSVGEVSYISNCTTKCTCQADSSLRCEAAKCPHGLMPVGSSHGKRFCIEITGPLTDECCVILACDKDLVPNERQAKSLEEVPTGRQAPKSDTIITDTEYMKTLNDLEQALLNRTEAGQVTDIIEELVPTTETSQDKATMSGTEPSINMEGTSEMEDLTTTQPKEATTMNPEESMITTGEPEEIVTDVPPKEVEEDQNRIGSQKLGNAFDDKIENNEFHHEKVSSKTDLHVVKTTHNSSTLALPSDAGGILHYRESRTGIGSSRKTIPKGQKEVVVESLAPLTRYTFKWTGLDGKSSKMEVKTQDGCRHNLISYPVGATWNEECLTTCDCTSGGVADCRPRCVFQKGSIQDKQCQEKPLESDPECCVEYICGKDKKDMNEASPKLKSLAATSDVEAKLIVTSRQHNSVTVAWDDFKAVAPEEHYVAEYRKVPLVKLETENPWMKKDTVKGNPPPTLTITDLMPNQLYEIRVSIYGSDEERKAASSTETITVRTEPGCVYGNGSFAVGEFYKGCDERCSCAPDGSVRCSERCSIPYFRKGSFDNDPLCTEELIDGDDCCVLIMCAHGELGGTDEDYDQCANTVCGANAECISLTSLTVVTRGSDALQPGSCQCKSGFSGDPNDLTIGCVSDGSPVPESQKCMFRQKSYSPGEVFYDNCQYKCTCDSRGEIACEPRCQFLSTSVPPNDGCVYSQDPNDECCLIRTCNTTNNKTPMSSPSLAFDGCTHANETYEKDEQFTIGCDLKCQCLGYGDVSCFPRCPPMKDPNSTDGEECQTLLDPADKCCNYTICAKRSPEVMKVEEDESMAEEEIVMAGAQGGGTTVTTEKTSSTTIVADKNGTTSSMKTTTPPTTLHNVTVTTVSPNALLNSSSTSTTLSNLNTTPVSTPVTQNGITMTGETNTTTQTTVTNTTKGATSKETSTTPISVPSTSTTSSNVNATGNGTTPLPETTMPMGNVSTSTPLSTSSTSTDTTTLNRNEILERRLRLEDHRPASNYIDILVVNPVDSATVQLNVKVSQDIMAQLLSFPKQSLTVSYSADSIVWQNQSIPFAAIQIKSVDTIELTVNDLSGHNANMFTVSYDGIKSSIRKSPLYVEPTKPRVLETTPSQSKCSFNGKSYDAKEDFYDGCKQFCMCTEELKIHCAPIECPDHFGLDIMDPDCLDWQDENVSSATPPNCCGVKPKCVLRISDLACTVQGHTFQHLDVLSQEFVRCDQRCQCMSGNLECENLCPSVQAQPPFDLPCHPSQATLVTSDGYPCCNQWKCVNGTATSAPQPYPSGPFGPIIPTQAPRAIALPFIDEVTPKSVKLSFFIPKSFVGLPGGIYLRYTQDTRTHPNPLDWQSEIIHEDGMTLTNSEWHYVKKNLQSGTNYSMQVALNSHLVKSEITSPTFSVSTLMEATTPLPRLELDASLSVSNIQNVSSRISWRQFTDFELRYIDGIRVRYWPANKKFPLEGPMLHRAADTMILRDLEPNTKYNVDLFFIPHEGLSTTITNTKTVSFTTLPKPKDKYAFNVSIQMGEITTQGVQIMYSGVLEPEGKYVNVFRVVYTSDGASRDSHKFKVPKNQKEGFILLTDLKPGVEYEVWLEAFLTNGGKKKSNVITIKTQPGDLPIPAKAGLEKSTAEGTEYSYYSSMVAVSILLALICVAFLAVLFLFCRKQNKATARISKSAYDNPSYKGSEGGYAMEMNGMKSSNNGNPREEV